jgi:hypothetical protein
VPPGDGIPFFVTSDEEAGEAARARVLASRASRTLGTSTSPDAALLEEAALSTDTEMRIVVLADGDEAMAASMLRATAKKSLRERRDAAIAAAARTVALDAVLGSELKRLEAGVGGGGGGGDVARPLAPLPRGKGPPLLLAGGSTAVRATTQKEVGAAALILRAARALLAGAAAPVGPNAPEPLVDACDALGIDVGALRRRVEAEGAAATAATATGEDSAFSSDEWDSDSGGASGSEAEAGGVARPPRIPAGGPAEEFPELAGIGLPEEWTGGVSGRMKFGGLAGKDLPLEAPGDLHPGAAAGPEVAAARARIAEVRARSELATATRFLLRALAASAEERAIGAGGATDAPIDVLPEVGGAPTAVGASSGSSLPAALVSAAALLTQRGSGRGGGALAQLLGGTGWLGFAGEAGSGVAAPDAGDEGAPRAQPQLQMRKAARHNRGGAVSSIPLSGPGGIAALAGVATGPLPLGVEPPPPPALDSEEEADLSEFLGYPPRDPKTGLALVVDKEALEAALRVRRAARDVSPRALAAADAAREAREFSALNAADTDAMIEMEEAEVDREDAARADSGKPRMLSTLPPGFRSWLEVAAASAPPPRPGAATAAAARKHSAVLNAVIRAPKDGSAPPTPRQTRASVNLRAALATVLAEGATGRLRGDFPGLFHGGLPIEVVEVALTPCLRTAHVRWTLPALARLRAEVAAGARPPPPPPPRAPFLPSARALIEEAERPREARAAAAASARRKPRKSDAYSPQSAAGGGMSPVLFGDQAAPSVAAIARATAGAAAALESAAWVLRREASARLRLRFVPRLHFFLWEGPRMEMAGEDRASPRAAPAALQKLAPPAASGARAKGRAAVVAYESATRRLEA